MVREVCGRIKPWLETALFSEEVKKSFVLLAKCWALLCFGIVAIIRANFLYIDDLGRSFSGSVSDWDTYSRYLSKFMCKLLSANDIVSDTSPLTQIITMFLMALAFVIVVKIIIPEKLDSNWMLLAVIPFALSPYFMENISYKIECVIHGTSTLLCVMPLLLAKKRNYLYVLFTTLCIVLLCVTYQGATGIFPMVIVALAAKEWNCGQNIKRIWKLIWTSVVGYGLGLVIFKMLIMKEVATQVSSKMWPLREVIPGAIKNIVSYYRVVLSDFNRLWIVLIIVIIASYIFAFTCSSKRNKCISFLVAIASVFILALVCHGIYPLLEQCIFVPRAMYSFGIFISLLSIFVIAKGWYVGKMACVALGWCFITFAFCYGNCLNLQQEYTDVKTQALMSYLNENFNDTNKTYKLEMNGYIGIAPAIQNKTENSKILSKLIPQTLGGGWVWAEYKVYMFYGLPSNYSVVWAWDKDNEVIGLTNKSLPKVDHTMWFDVYSDGSNILVQFNN